MLGQLHELRPVGVRLSDHAADSVLHRSENSAFVILLEELALVREHAVEARQTLEHEDVPLV